MSREFIKIVFDNELTVVYIQTSKSPHKHFFSNYKELSIAINTKYTTKVLTVLKALTDNTIIQLMSYETRTKDNEQRT